MVDDAGDKEDRCSSGSCLMGRFKDICGSEVVDAIGFAGGVGFTDNNVDAVFEDDGGFSDEQEATVSISSEASAKVAHLSHCSGPGSSDIKLEHAWQAVQSVFRKLLIAEFPLS